VFKNSLGQEEVLLTPNSNVALVPSASAPGLCGEDTTSTLTSLL